MDKSQNQPYIADSIIQFPTGQLKLSEIRHLFDALPYEVDFVDATDHFKFFSDQPHREHPRSVDALGEHVKDCHPKQAVPAVLEILSSMREGRTDRVERTLNLNGKYVHINYIAIRDNQDKYLGCLEFTANVTDLINKFQNGKFTSPADEITGASDSKIAQTKKNAESQQSDSVSGASEC